MQHEWMNRARWWIPGLLIAAALWPARPSAGQQLALEDFQGDYAFAGGQREERRLGAAIDRVVDQMNLFVREIARGEIRGHVQPERRVRIEVPDDGRVRLAFDDWRPNPLSLDGRPLRVRGPDGSATRLRGRFDDGRLYMHQTNPQGERHNWLQLAGDRERLTMRVRISAGQLPDDIEYALTYRRR